MLQMSALVPYGRLSQTSGAKYTGVPIMVLACAAV